jgi:hypothetical protein
LDKVVLNLKK